jgi:Uma2 family endonuclease
VGDQRYDEFMASGTTLVSEQEYLSTTYKPACDYIDGVLRQKSMPTWKHGVIQGTLIALIKNGFRRFLAAAEVTVKIRTGKYFVPDVVIQRRDRIQEPYPAEPVHVCVEILSPEDRVSETFAKCEEYHEWGVEMTWIIDPESRRAWEYRKGQLFVEIPETGSLTADGISIPLHEVFADL